MRKALTAAAAVALFTAAITATAGLASDAMSAAAAAAVRTVRMVMVPSGVRIPALSRRPVHARQRRWTAVFRKLDSG